MTIPTALKVVLRIVGGALVAVLVLGGGYATATQLASTESTEHLTLDSSGVQSIVARTDVGDVRVETSPSATNIEVELHREGSWRLPSFEQRRSGSELVLDGSCRHGMWGDCSTDMVLHVPEGLQLRASASVGKVWVDGDFTQLSMESSTGSLTAQGVRADRIHALSSVGDVRLHLAAPADSVEATNSVGGVKVVVPDDGTAYDVQVQTSVGESQTSVPVDPSSPHLIRVTSSVGDVQVVTTADESP
jgi:Putative adhesin